MSFLIGDATLRGILSDTGRAIDIARRWKVCSTTVYITKRLHSRKAADMAFRVRSEGLDVIIWPPASAKRPPLSPRAVETIRASAESSTALAAQHGCSPSMIRMIRTGRSYK